MFNYFRRKTEQIAIGNLTLGGGAPIRIQTMANTDTNDIDASVCQAEKCYAAGAELLRFTTQGNKEATSLGLIHSRLCETGINIPLVADIHFNPKVAETAAALVEKIRINPGNFVAGKEGEYTQEEWDAELETVRQKLRPLLTICKQHGTAVRIGVNHGSLSPRVMSQYGNTPEGLATSCIEFIKLCEKEDFRNIVLSVKASNTVVMIHAVRKLVRMMDELGMRYPIHLGVTEAGSDDEGRVKSAVGIGTLLAEGIGDTIRVSLSESPDAEIPVARKLVDYISSRQHHPHIDGTVSEGYSPFSFSRRASIKVDKVGGGQPPIVIASKSNESTIQADYIATENALSLYPLLYGDLTENVIKHLKSNPSTVILLSSTHQNPVGEMRAAIHRMINESIENPIIAAHVYKENDTESLQIKSAADFGPLLIDGLIDGIYLQNISDNIPEETLVSTSFNILQAARARVSMTEYISCPSCGRTKFDLPSVVKKVKQATEHLVGLKIAVMGCIVNGPGEMADADYGYIGAGMGKVSLYKGKECVIKNIPEADAIPALIRLINETNAV